MKNLQELVKIKAAKARKSVKLAFSTRCDQLLCSLREFEIDFINLTQQLNELREQRDWNASSLETKMPYTPSYRTVQKASYDFYTSMAQKANCSNQAHYTHHTLLCLGDSWKNETCFELGMAHSLAQSQTIMYVTAKSSSDCSYNLQVTTTFSKVANCGVEFA